MGSNQEFLAGMTYFVRKWLLYMYIYIQGGMTILSSLRVLPFMADMELTGCRQLCPCQNMYMLQAHEIHRMSPVGIRRPVN